MHRNELLDFKSMDLVSEYKTEYGEFKVFKNRKTSELIYFGYVLTETTSPLLINYSRDKKRCEMKVKLFIERGKK